MFIIISHKCYDNVMFYSVHYFGKYKAKKYLVSIKTKISQFDPFVFIRLSVMYGHDEMKLNFFLSSV